MPFLDNYEATPAGEQLLQEGNDSLIAVVDAFYDATDRAPESALFDAVYAHDGYYIGAGRFSHVMRLGDYAIKVSTLTSAASEERPDVEPFAEDAVWQMHFLHELREHFASQPDIGLTTPEQYFAVQGSHGGRLVVQQFMDGWETVGNWADRALRFKDDDTYNKAIDTLSDQIKERVERAVAGTALRAELNDLRLDDPEIHPNNFLVPKGSVFDAASVPLCIIDQPKRYRKLSGELLDPKALKRMREN
jgi:hypothetical protein